ncbi:PAR14-like protein, partial [Mya arenaria]
KTKQVSSDNIEKDQSFGLYTTSSGLNVLVYQQHILSIGVECITSASNKKLVHERGVACDIAKAAGLHYVQACNEIITANGELKVGTAVATSSGNLRFACIIQAIGPRWFNYDTSSFTGVHQCSEDLLTTVYNVLKVVNEMQMASVALPAISSAFSGVPLKLCAMEYARAAKRFSKDFPGANLREVHFVDRSAVKVEVIQESFHRLITEDKDDINDRLKFITKRRL